MSRYPCRACGTLTTGAVGNDPACYRCYVEGIFLLSTDTTKAQTIIGCGSREWDDRLIIRKSFDYLASRNPQLRVIHGGARGADTLIDQATRILGINTQAELADWVGRGRGEGRQRNARMLALRPDIVLAFKDRFDFTLKRGGTEHMCKIALKAHVPVYLYQHETGWRSLPL